MTRLKDVPAAMLKVLPKAVYHYTAAEKAKAPYIVWAEDMQGKAVCSDNVMSSQAISGTVDYYTRTEYDVNVDKIQLAFRVSHIPYRLNSVQYETDTGLIHFEWAWEVGGWLN